MFVFGDLRQKLWGCFWGGFSFIGGLDVVHWRFLKREGDVNMWEQIGPHSVCFFVLFFCAV